MDPQAFDKSASGRVIRQPSGYYAFLPDAPPDAIDYNQIIGDLSRADAAVGELSGLARHLPNPHLLIAPYVRREAVASSRTEGTQASLSDLLLTEATDKEQPGSDVYEIRNYIAALEFGIAGLQKLPIATRLITQMQRGAAARGAGGGKIAGGVSAKPKLDSRVISRRRPLRPAAAARIAAPSVGMGKVHQRPRRHALARALRNRPRIL